MIYKMIFTLSGNAWILEIRIVDGIRMPDAVQPNPKSKRSSVYHLSKLNLPRNLTSPLKQISSPLKKEMGFIT